VKAGDLVTMKSSGRLMKVLQVHVKTGQLCVLPADTGKSNIGLWVKLSDLEVPGLRSKNSSLSI
jgi:hypothetical protein